MRNPIKVITLNMTTEEIYDERVVDHSNDSDRRWLGNHTYWAVRNDHGVQVSPHVEDKS